MHTTVAHTLATAADGPWRTHRPFGALLILFLLARLGTAWHTDEYVLLNADYNVINLVALAEHHDIPALDDMETGNVRDALAYSSAYFLVGLGLDSIGISPRVVAVLHQVFGPVLLAVAVYGSAWVLFGSFDIALLAALLLSFVDYAWFRINVGYPVLFNQSLYYGDVNQVFAAALITGLLARRFALAAAASVLLSLLNPTYGFNGMLLLAGTWLAATIAKKRQPSPGWAVCVSIAGVAVGYGLALIAQTLASPDATIPVAERDIAIQTYGHVAIHASYPLYYIAGVGAVLTVLPAALWIERRAAPRQFGGTRDWFELVAWTMLALAVVQGVIVYWVLFIAWPEGLIAASPSKSLMLAALFTCPYLAYAVARALDSRWGVAVVIIVLALLSARQSVAGVMIAGVVIVVWAALTSDRRVTRLEIRASAWIVVIMLVVDLGLATARPFTSGAIERATELKDMSLRMRLALSPDAVLVPFRIGPPEKWIGPFAPFTNLSLRTFSRRGYLPYWSVGRNAYFNSMRRHLAEERAFAAAGLALWTDVLPGLDRERRENPVEYYTGLVVRAAPCCRIGLDAPTPVLALSAKGAELRRFVEHATPREFAAYAARLGGTHLFVSKDPGTAPPWEPVVLESAHFLVIPIPDELRPVRQP